MSCCGRPNEFLLVFCVLNSDTMCSPSVFAYTMAVIMHSSRILTDTLRSHTIEFLLSIIIMKLSCIKFLIIATMKILSIKLLIIAIIIIIVIMKLFGVKFLTISITMITIIMKLSGFKFLIIAIITILAFIITIIISIIDIIKLFFPMWQNFQFLCDSFASPAIGNISFFL